MRLINFKAGSVHGYLNFDLNFKDDITFLIGINGTGKTSVLKLILGLISPSYKYLNQIEFNYAELTFGNDINLPSAIIQANKKDPNIVEITLFLIPDTYYEEGQANLDSKEKEITTFSGSLIRTDFKIIDNEHSPEEIREKNQLLQNQFENQIIYKEIAKLASPLFLGLDRRIYEGSKIDRRALVNRARYNRHTNFPANEHLNMSLWDLQAIIYDYHRVIGARQSKYNEQFKNQILEKSFDFAEASEFNLKSDYKELLQKKIQILQAIEKLSVNSLVDKINTFFDKMVEVMRDVQNRDINTPENDKSTMNSVQKWFMNQPQLKRIDEIISYSLTYQKQIEKLHEPINRLKSIIDKFFSEGNKELLITPEGELIINLVRIGKPTSCYELSSGEKQILTMIGHLVFYDENFEKEPGIFIIDEPELSLHLAWQEIFVKSIQEASPKTQFILATHSPSILSDYSEANCEDLAKIN